MKKVYEAPSVEKVEFQYRDQVVVASAPGTQTRCIVATDHFFNAQGTGNSACHLTDKCQTVVIQANEHYD